MIASQYAISYGGAENRLNPFTWLFCYAHTDAEAVEIAKENGVVHGEVADLTARRRVWIKF